MVKQKYLKELLTVMIRIRNPKLLEAFLKDLLTPQELDEIITRWQIVKRLAVNIPQREISKELKVSISKITRGSRELLDPNGGFQKILLATNKKKYENNK